MLKLWRNFWIYLKKKPNLIKTSYNVKDWLIKIMPEYITGVYAGPLHYKIEKINGMVSIFYKDEHVTGWAHP